MLLDSVARTSIKLSGGMDEFGLDGNQREGIHDFQFEKRPDHLRVDKMEDLAAFVEDGNTMQLNVESTHENLRLLDSAIVGKIIGKRLPFYVLNAELKRLWGQPIWIDAQTNSWGRREYAGVFVRFDPGKKLPTGVWGIESLEFKIFQEKLRDRRREVRIGIKQPLLFNAAPNSKKQETKNKISKAHLEKELMQLGPIEDKSRKRKKEYEAIGGRDASPFCIMRNVLLSQGSCWNLVVVFANKNYYARRSLWSDIAVAIDRDIPTIELLDQLKHFAIHNPVMDMIICSVVHQTWRARNAKKYDKSYEMLVVLSLKEGAED
ncbi:hypothetical protein M5K25_012303 [Dendrobium thyrsiflorum]|uniref:DUF4283 domain-containing protein n=1 Tax=Dendrobium thyrsiflorum TaxID=117978 RepID=A0ABD0V3Q2_DENTH